MTKQDSGILAQQLDGVLEELRREAEGSRCTLRFDDPERGWDVNFVVAEALSPGVKSLRAESSIDQRSATSVLWLTEHRRNLVQPDLLNAPDPPPPPALLKAYGATAQMLAPLLNAEDHLQGWISVHYVGGGHDVNERHEAALSAARSKVAGLLGLPNQ